MSDKRVLFTLVHGPEHCDLGRHTAIAGMQRVARQIGHVVQPHLSLVRPMRAGKHFHECAFSGPVLADQGVNLAAFNRQIHSSQGMRRSKPFVDAPHS